MRPTPTEVPTTLTAWRETVERRIRAKARTEITKSIKEAEKRKFIDDTPKREAARLCYAPGG